ncbi:MAG: tRNA pseudouridine(38-40) synthase TruA [Deltaproteobacteria bacterium]|nr:tRNA pseudouridine(38-40) synthase TruA [Deltaproteobacteria bacterium]
MRLLVAYDGSAYVGWQVQPNGPSVQAAIEAAFERLTGSAGRARAASRTDAGVHALGQVVVLDEPGRHGPEVVRKGLNALLPDDIVVREAELAPPGFDPRHSACGKHYRYSFHNDRVPPLFRRGQRWHIRAPLDLESMQRACAHLQGEHDFSAFRAAGCEAKSPVRRIDRIGLVRDGSLLALDVLGRAFLKQMVRNLAGTLVDVGRGRLSPEGLRGLLLGRDRTRAGRCAPAKGLCLVRVFYEPDAYRRAVEGEAGPAGGDLFSL